MITRLPGEATWGCRGKAAIVAAVVCAALGVAGGSANAGVTSSESTVWNGQRQVGRGGVESGPKGAATRVYARDLAADGLVVETAYRLKDGRRGVSGGAGDTTVGRSDTYLDVDSPRNPIAAYQVCAARGDVRYCSAWTSLE